MKEYKNIDKIETLDDGTMNVYLKNGKAAIIEIIRFNEKFQAAVYHAFLGAKMEPKKEKKSLLVQLEKYDGYKGCAKDALGWVDDHTDRLYVEEEKKGCKPTSL